MDNKENKTSELRLVLIWMVGDEKTSVMNILLGKSENQKPEVEDENTFLPDAEKCQKVKITINAQRMVIVSTPGLCNAQKPDKDVMEEVKKGVSELAPGPHVFLLVLPLEPFTEGVQNAVKLFKTTFGESLMKFMMVLFPEGETLGTETIEEFITKSEDLKKFAFDECERRYHVLHSDPDLHQVTELVEKFQNMVQDNKGNFYVDVRARRKRIALSINGAAVVGAGVGGAVSQFVGSPIGLAGGLGLGAGVGGVVGLVGIVAVEKSKKQGCVLH